MRLWPVILTAAVAGSAPADPTLTDSIATVRRAGPGGEGSDAAAKAWRQLAAAGPADLPVLLAGMDGARACPMNRLALVFGGTVAGSPA